MARPRPFTPLEDGYTVLLINSVPGDFRHFAADCSLPMGEGGDAAANKHVRRLNLATS
jgi:hypothetical protein